MDDFVAAVEGRVFIPEGMESMRIGGDDPREAIPGQRGDVAAGEILEGCLVAEAAGEIAAVQLLLAEHGEIDPGLAQEPDERAQRALVAQLEGAVAEPQQHVGLALPGQDGEREIGGPVEPAGQRAAAGIVGGAQFGQRVGGLAGRRTQLQRLEATQIDDGVDMLDHHRTFVDAGAAGGAGPQRIRMDHGVDADKRIRAAAARLADGAAGMGVAGVAGIRSRAERVGEILDQLLRIERLLGGEGGTGGLAAAALHAGIERQQLVPAEVARRLAAELRRVERQRAQRGLARPPAKRAARGWKARWSAPARAWRMGPTLMPANSSQQPHAPITSSTKPPISCHSIGRPKPASGALREGEEERKGEERVGQALEGAARELRSPRLPSAAMPP